MRVAVLAVQGGFAPHIERLRALGHDAWAARAPRDLAQAEGLVLPGGESSAQLRLIASAKLRAPLDALFARGVPVLATCAGLILAARRVTGPAQESFGWLALDVERNGWGRQLDSFEATADAGAGFEALPLTFIRAPRITAVADGVEVLARLPDGEPILARQGAVWGATFHPELTRDDRLHARVFGRAAPTSDLTASR